MGKAYITGVNVRGTGCVQVPLHYADVIATRPWLRGSGCFGGNVLKTSNECVKYMLQTC